MKHLVLITRGKNTWQTLYDQLTGLLGHHVAISGYHLGGKLPDHIQGDLILASSQELVPEILGLIRPGCPLVVASRAINYHEIEKLFDIPSGTDVLLVSDALPAAEETISLLLALGIDHIRYHPYVPGLSRYSRIKIAVTPGEPDCVPAWVEHIVDINSRYVDITTLAEIIDRLSLIDARANILSANYMRDVIQLIRKNKQNARISYLLNNKLHAVINTVHDGILAVDETNSVSVINPVAERLLALDAAQGTGKKLDEIVNGNIKEMLIQASEQHHEKFIRYNNRQFIVNTAAIHDNEKAAGFVYTFKDVSEIQRLEEELRRKTVKEQLVARYTLKQIIGASPVIRDTIDKAYRLAASESPILIQGESGTGKELLAQGIHNASSRRHGPFIAVNFAALSESLIESELFGYEEGAFTGARKGGAPGLFEQAHKGTIFLDEIGDSPLASQVRILRVLQEKQVRRIGSARNIPVDVRVISATNQSLKALMTRGLFRKDLYYRLNVLSLSLPSLKEREDDIIMLAKHYYRKFKPAANAPSPDVYFSLIKPYLLAYDWPGNIRELQNAVEYLISICPGEAPAAHLLPEEIRHCLTAAEVLLLGDGSGDRAGLREKVLREIIRCNQKGLPIGRRSLAAALALPESLVRKIIAELQASGHIVVNRGRNGLQPAGGRDARPL